MRYILLIIVMIFMVSCAARRPKYYMCSIGAPSKHDSLGIYTLKP